MQVISSGGIPLALALGVRGYRLRRPGWVVAGSAVAAWQLSIGFTLGLPFAYLLAASRRSGRSSGCGAAARASTAGSCSPPLPARCCSPRSGSRSAGPTCGWRTRTRRRAARRPRWRPTRGRCGSSWWRPTRT